MKILALAAALTLTLSTQTAKGPAAQPAASAGKSVQVTLVRWPFT